MIRYIQGSFYFIQNWAANTILRRKSNVPGALIACVLVPFDNSIDTVDEFPEMMQIFFPFFCFLMFVPLLYRSVYRIVYEKSSNTKESLKMMGMNEASYWLSWFAYYTLLNTVMVSMAIPVLSIGVFQRQSMATLWLAKWLYGQSLFGLVMITQSLFMAPRAAAISTTGIYFGLTMLSGFFDEDTTRTNKFILYSLLPQVTMQETMKAFVAFEHTIGMTQATWAVEYNDISLKEAYICFVVSGSLLMLLGFYMEAVMPKNLG